MSGIYNGGQIDKVFLSREIFELTFRIECRSRLSASDIFDRLKELIEEKDIVELGRTNSLSWCVTVATKDAAEILRAAGIVSCKGREFRMTSVSNQLVEVRCHWLPAYVKDSFLRYLFAGYGRVVNVTRDSTVLGHNISRRNGVRVVHLETDDLVKGSIPHLMKFEGGISMLITIPGRPPLCLKCHSVGHVRRDCSFSAPPQQQQRRTYAAAVAADETLQDSQLSDDNEEVQHEDETTGKETDMTDSQKEGEEEKTPTSAKSNEVQQSEGNKSSWAEGSLDLITPGQLQIDDERMATEEEESSEDTFELVVRGPRKKMAKLSDI